MRLAPQSGVQPTGEGQVLWGARPQLCQVFLNPVVLWEEQAFLLCSASQAEGPGNGVRMATSLCPPYREESRTGLGKMTGRWARSEVTQARKAGATPGWEAFSRVLGERHWAPRRCEGKEWS